MTLEANLWNRSRLLFKDFRRNTILIIPGSFAQPILTHRIEELHLVDANCEPEQTYPRM